jgi:hypothetical protein
LNDKTSTVDFLGVTQDIITALDKKADQADFISVTSATIDALDKKVDTTDFLIVSNNVLASLKEKVDKVDFLGVVQDTISSIKERALAGANTDITSLVGLTSYSFTGNQSLSLSTLGSQPQPVIGSFYSKTNTISETSMEFIDAAEVFSSTGNTVGKLAADNYRRSKVALYRAIFGNAGGGDIYAGNFVSQSNAGHSGNNMTLEVDLNSQSGNAALTFADLQAGRNVHAPIYISGQVGVGTANDQNISGAILVNLSAGGFKPARGIGIFNGTVYGNIYEDNVTATANVLRSTGTKAGGIDFTGLTIQSGNALSMAFGHYLRWYSSDGLTVIGDVVDGSKIRQVGVNAASINLNAPATGISLSLAGSSTAAALIATGSYTAGIDLSSATLSSFGIKLPNNAPISWLSSTATGNFKALYVDTANRLIVGNGITTRINITTNQNLDVRGPISLGSGMSITSQNDAGNALLPMEILGSSFKFNGGTALFSNGLTVPNNISINLTNTSSSLVSGIYMDTSNRVIVGPGSVTRIKPGTDANIEVAGAISLGSGTSLTSINDAGSALVPLEFRASSFRITGGTLLVGKDLSILGNTQKSASIIAAAGTTQATATALIVDIALVNSGSGGGIVLQNKIGQKQEIFNRSGAAINIYPPTGASIESAGTNVAVSLANGGHATFIALTATQIYQTV